MKNRFKNVPQKVVDFVMTPLDPTVSKPIVIETDGIRYHAESVTKDILDRLEMIRSGEVSVWSFAWHDLQVKGSKSYSNPLSSESLQPESLGHLARVLGYFKAYSQHIQDVQQMGSFELLVATLQSPGFYQIPTRIFLRGLVGAGLPSSLVTAFESFREENRDWLREKPLAQITHAPQLDLAVSLDRVQPSEFESVVDDIRVLVCFNHPPLSSEAEITEDFVAGFRGLWRSVNILQHFPGLHIAFPGLDTLDLPIKPSELPSDAEIDAVWAEVRVEVLDDFHILVDALIAAGIAAPDAIGEELMAGTRVIGAAEIGWREKDVWVSEDDTLKSDSVIFWDLTAETIPAVIAEIISRLESSEGAN